MKIFNIYYSGVISIEAETEEEAENEFYLKYSDCADIDGIQDVTEELADWEK